MDWRFKPSNDAWAYILWNLIQQHCTTTTASNWSCSVGRPEEPYYIIVVETYRITGSGLHGDIHVRPVKGEQFPQTMHVRFPRKVRHAHPIGTRFRVYAKLTDKEGGNPFLHTNHAWDYEILDD
jgi:hypothetical protein